MYRSTMRWIELALAIAAAQALHSATASERYVCVPADTFQMGCSPQDADCRADEEPRHKVQITHSFCIGRTEVTVAEYRRFATATDVTMPPDQGSDDEPLVNVT